MPVLFLAFLLCIWLLYLKITGTSHQRFEEGPAWLTCWMKDIPDDTLLRKIVIPGSHDSGTAGTIWAAETQVYSFKQQLETGIRYFDTRVHKKGDKYFIFHSIIDGVEFPPILKDVSKFLDDNPSEVILLDFQHFKGESQSDVAKMLIDILGDKLLHNESQDSNLDFIHNLTLGEARGKCIAFWGDRNDELADFKFVRNDNECTTGEQCLDSFYLRDCHHGDTSRLINEGHPEYFGRARMLEDKGKSGVFVLQCQLGDSKVVFGPYSKEKNHDEPISKYICDLPNHPDFDLVNVIMRDFICPRKVIDIINLNSYKDNLFHSH